MKQPKLNDDKIDKSAALDVTELFLNKPLINLDLAGILYVSAYNSYLKGKASYLKLTQKIDKYNSYKERKDKIKWYREFMLKKLRELEHQYEPVVREFSSTKILLVNCAEAFINEVASCELSGRQLDEFDKLSIVGKWLFIPSILKLKKKAFFSLDKNPLQGFAKLVKERNKLVHFKGLRTYLENQNLPNLTSSYNLTPDSCKENLEIVKELIENLELAWVGSYAPYWLNIEKATFRRPCFYVGARNYASYLFSERLDKKWHESI